MNHDLSPVFAQGGLFHASHMELHFDALRGTRTFGGDPSVHSHMTSEGHFPWWPCPFQYTAQRLCVSC